MLIEPNTVIKVLRGVPLDNSYRHTLYFDSVSSQTAYFQSMLGTTLERQSYQRVQRGVARVQVRADWIYDCNYMMFQNTNYGSKWFYAFITSVEYVNDVTSEITFEIDVMQTWFFDYHSCDCFIEREHVMSDSIGQHIEAEPVELGEYVFNNDYSPTLELSPDAVIIAILDTGGKAAEGNLYDGVYSGADLWVYDYTDNAGITGKLTQYIQKPDSVVSIYMCPKKFINNGTIPTSHKLSYGTRATPYEKTFRKCDPDTMVIGGYHPRNKKLFTYPYNFFHVDNANGSSLTLRYEFFDELIPKVEIYGCLSTPVTAVLSPKSYDGLPNITLHSQSLSITNYPLCSWSYDAYQAWIAQNAVPLGVNTAVGIANTVGSNIINPVGMVTGIIGEAANAAMQGYKAAIAADMAKGSMDNGNANVSNGYSDFFFGQMSITYQYAEVIDEFFDMFGYTVNRVKKPNISGRRHWNYVKTIGWQGRGNVPADDMKKIASIYDSGVTFWKKGEEVGNYNLDNRL